MLVIAHRGASAAEPENTLRAFARAIEMGAGMIELDLQLTRDDRVVVIHDDDLSCTTNLRGFISRSSLEEVRRADAGRGERIPTLEETLELARGRIQLYLEIKNPLAAKETIRQVREFKMQSDVMLASFNLKLMRELGREVPDIERGVILGSPSINPIVRWREAFPWLALDSINYQTLCMQVELCFPYLARRVKKQGKKLYVWTANSKRSYARMLACNVDGICTDTPDHLIEYLSKRNSN
ncbi:MAG TPA: glycerophosphodiester phosphodiesterase [Blastocatellia bacterium]|nr:glycerophosphodiester phosphodiesterase [Blastocatellia bacterium]